MFLISFLCVSIAPPAKTVVKERRPSSGGIKQVQQVFYTEWKNETGLLQVLFLFNDRSVTFG